jgi:hypothetical protein
MDSQMSRARTLKAAIEAGFLARHGIENAVRELDSSGSIAATRRLTMEGGEIDVAAEGPRPPGSGRYVVFSRARFNRVSVLTIADVKMASPRPVALNWQVLYQDLDPTAGPVRSQLMNERGRALKRLRDRVRAYRAEGAGLSGRLGTFLGGAIEGQIPAADRTRILSILPAVLATTVP